MRTVVHVAGLLLLLVVTGCTTQPEKNIDNRKVSQTNTELGVAYIQQGHYKVAMRKLKKAIAYDDENADAHHYIAELYRRLGENEKSEEHFKRAMELDEDNTSIKNNYAVFLCSTGRYEEGIQYFNEALEDPLYVDKGGAYENIGICAEKEGNIKQAEDNYRKALKFNNRSPHALLGLAQIAFDSNDIKSAAFYLALRNKVARPNAQSLWLEILIARSKGMKSHAGSLALKLKQYFPDSKEAALLKKLR